MVVRAFALEVSNGRVRDKVFGQGVRMSAPPGSPPDPGASPPETDDALLESVMREVPRGALALAALTVGLMLVAWFFIYAFVFLPRGTVG
jgi:hypothetical protein